MALNGSDNPADHKRNVVIGNLKRQEWWRCNIYFSGPVATYWHLLLHMSQALEHPSLYAPQMMTFSNPKIECFPTILP